MTDPFVLTLRCEEAVDVLAQFLECLLVPTR